MLEQRRAGSGRRLAENPQQGSDHPQLGPSLKVSIMFSSLLSHCFGALCTNRTLCW